MDSTVMNNHIKLFVNEFTLNLGDKGREAITELFRYAGEKGVIEHCRKGFFYLPLGTMMFKNLILNIHYCSLF